MWQVEKRGGLSEGGEGGDEEEDSIYAEVSSVIWII